jgi:hypothetical protein
VPRLPRGQGDARAHAPRRGAAGQRLLRLSHAARGLRALPGPALAPHRLAPERRAPRTADTGARPACNLCHVDRSLAWTGAELSRGWGVEAAPVDDDDVGARRAPRALGRRGEPGGARRQPRERGRSPRADAGSWLLRSPSWWGTPTRPCASWPCAGSKSSASCPPRALDFLVAPASRELERERAWRFVEALPAVEGEPRARLRSRHRAHGRARRSRRGDRRVSARRARDPSRASAASPMSPREPSSEARPHGEPERAARLSGDPAPLVALGELGPRVEALALRHLFFGWLGLLVFVLLGVVLEALHGLKAPWLLDPGSEARRPLSAARPRARHAARARARRLRALAPGRPAPRLGALVARARRRERADPVRVSCSARSLRAGPTLGSSCCSCPPARSPS